MFPQKQVKVVLSAVQCTNTHRTFFTKVNWGYRANDQKPKMYRMTNFRKFRQGNETTAQSRWYNARTQNCAQTKTWEPREKEQTLKKARGKTSSLGESQNECGDTGEGNAFEISRKRMKIDDCHYDTALACVLIVLSCDHAWSRLLGLGPGGTPRILIVCSQYASHGYKISGRAGTHRMQLQSHSQQLIASQQLP